TDEETGEPVERLRAMASVSGKGMARWYLGRTPEAPKANFAEIVVRTTKGAYTSDYVKELFHIIRNGDEALGLKPVTSGRVIPRELMLGPVVDAPIGIRVFGPRQGSAFADYNVMRGQAWHLKNIFIAHPGTWDIYDTWGSPSYQLDVDVDEDRANLAGVTNDSLAQTLNAYYSGHTLTTFREGDHVVPVMLRLPAEQRGSIEGLKSAYVEGKSGKVPLDAVASIEAKYAPAKIERRFLQRVIEVRARNKPGWRSNDIVGEVLGSKEYQAWKANLPPGYWVEIGGELFESSQSKSELQVSLIISVLAIILLLIVQYNGVMKPFIILSTLPLAVVGALLGLYLTDNALGFMPQLGLLSLFGIVVNTAIIFLEFADDSIRSLAAEKNGDGPVLGLTVHEFRECLAAAGKARLLPIAETALTTIGGLLPLALAGGPLWEGMSWLMIVGLAFATVLTLVVVPCIYAVFVETFGMDPVADPREPAAA
ncbi:MAG: efflux RND transporter permease subunit, partial [Planctomycetota bacterium]